MLAYCNETRVVARHSDDQAVPASAYGDGITVLRLPDDFVFATLNEHGDLARPKPEDVRAPSSVDPVEFRRALRAAGLKAAFDEFLADQPEEISEAWEYSTAITATNPALVAAAAHLKISDKAMADLFKVAAGLPVASRRKS